MKNKKKKKFLNFYDWVYKRDRKEDADDDRDAPRNLPFYFKLLWRNFGRIFSLNIYFILGNFSLWLILLVPSGIIGPSSTAPTSEFFGPLYGASLFSGGTPVTNAFLAVHGTITDITIMTPFMWVLLIIGAVILLATFGPVMTGISYNLRNIVKGDPLFMWSDFKYAIKSNLRQSIILGIMDVVITASLIYGIIFYYMNLHSTIFGVFFYFTIFLLILYSFMRKYIYLMLVTFKLSIPKIFKNALIFSMLGLGRNILSTVGCLIVAFLNWLLLSVFFPLGIVMPLIITVAIMLFTDAYAAWPKIQAVMIDPYVNEES